VVDLATNLAPTFATFTDSTGAVLKIQPTVVSSTSLKVTASDSLLSVSGTFTVTVTNTVPTFSTNPTDQTLQLCTSSSYTLPSIVDPNVPCQTTSVSPSVVLAYASLSGTTFTFNPTALQTDTITVSISDGVGTSPAYSFAVTTVNTAPTFQRSLADQYVTVGDSVTYNLPAIDDINSACQTVSTTIVEQSKSTLPSFVTIPDPSNSIIVITPTQQNAGTTNLTITLSDGVDSSSYSISIFVQGIATNTIAVTLNNSAPPMFQDSLNSTINVTAG
jgi:hypothetical protein